jgi:hypothetical protein
VRTQIAAFFRRHSWANSVTLLVSQYWNDEADDAVHPHWAASCLYDIDLDAYAVEAYGVDGALPASADVELLRVRNVPGGTDPWDIHAELAYGFTTDAAGNHQTDRSSAVRWDSNGKMIPLFAAYCTGGAYQDQSLLEAYRPYAVFRRDSDEVTVEVVGIARRPWLDGVPPGDCDDDENGYDTSPSVGGEVGP